MTSTAAALALRIRYSRTATHIEGFETATRGGGNDMGSHISYAADSHCAALTRGATRMGYVDATVERRNADDPTIPVGQVKRSRVICEFTTAQEAYDAALAYAKRNHGDRICAKCEAAAVAAGATV